MKAPLLRVERVTKRFGGTAALDDVSLDVEAGRVHAILGENGAGKTTLLNLLFGLAQPDAGRILWNGAPVRLESPADSIRLGIGMVHQHFMLVSALTVWENVLLTHPERARFLVRRDAAREWVRTISARHGLALDPDARVESLPVGARQRVEIAKALARDAQLLILDEPTAVLAPRETRELLARVKSLRGRGAAVLFVSHKIPEVIEIADRVTVLRRGRTAGSFSGALDPRELAARVLGGEGTGPGSGAGGGGEGGAGEGGGGEGGAGEAGAGEGGGRAGASPGGAGDGGVRRDIPGLALRELGARFAHGVDVEDVSLDVAAGTIVGVAGVDGNGQEELAALLAGMVRPDSGSIHLAGEDVTGDDAAVRWRKGLGILPGDRGREGLVLDLSVWENLALRTFGANEARRAGGLLVEPSVHRAEAVRLLEAFDVRGPGIDAPARSLSGGNQQKLLLARELSRSPKALVALHPTRGLDVGAAAEVAARLRRLRDAGAAILLVSTELDELLEIADRVGVLVRGRWREIVSRDREEVGTAMLGGDAPAPAGAA